jgi:hypothetical protein
MLVVSIILQCPCFLTHHCYLAWFRLFVGDLSNDVSDDVLANAFNKYTSFQKARVIRDRLSQKVWITHFLHGLRPKSTFCRRSMGLLPSLTQKTF